MADLVAGGAPGIVRGLMAVTDLPLVRAQFCQEWLARVAKEEDPWRSRFQALLPPDVRYVVESASRVEWIPMTTHVVLADVLDKAFGASRAHDYYRRAFAASLRGPFFGPLVQTAVRILGMTPASFVRYAGRAYDAGFKNGGQLVGEILGPGRARLLYSGLPAMCIASDAWMTSAQGSTYGALDVLGVTGVVRLDHTRRAEGALAVTLEWNER